MGWGSAGLKIFDPVARALTEAGAADETKGRVLGDLIVTQAEDWDTEQDSLDRFADDPVIVRVFAAHGIHRPGTQ